MPDQPNKAAKRRLKQQSALARFAGRRSIAAAKSEAAALYEAFLQSDRPMYWLQDDSSNVSMRYLSSFLDDGVSGHVDLVGRNGVSGRATANVLVRTCWYGPSAAIDHVRMERDGLVREVRSLIASPERVPFDPEWTVEQVEVDGRLVDFHVAEGVGCLVMAGRPAPSCVVALHVEGERRKMLLSSSIVRSAFMSPAELFD
ncbi:MAG TPA: hypothetical protein VEW93_11320 [Acidimicrobiales bacterium]|nr:hypothetical protein [Acidimicrobiales bacterium]